jgi:hypothetical protein
LSNEKKEQRIENINELETVVEIATGADVNVNELKTPSKDIAKDYEKVAEKCVKVISSIVCEEDVVSVAIGRYWVEGKVISVSKFGITVQNPLKEHTIRLGKISFVVIHQRGKHYSKYIELINKIFGKE